MLVLNYLLCWVNGLVCEEHFDLLKAANLVDLQQHEAQQR